MALLWMGRMRTRLAGVFALAGCVLTMVVAISAAAAATTHTIVMEGVAFVPKTLTVKQGDTIIWVNKDLFPHTATAQDRSFDSPEMAPNKTWKYTATKSGTFPYVCTLHPTMKGTLVVE